MKHWLQLVAIPNAPSSSSSQELQSLKKRISDLEKARSRSPRRSNQKQLAAASGPQMLALPAPSAPAQGRKSGKDRRRSGTGRHVAKGSGKGQASKDFDYLMKLPLEFRSNFHEKFHKKTRSATSSRSMLANFLTTNASSRMYVWGVAVRSLMTSASASPQKSTESHLRHSLIQFRRFPLSCPFPPVIPIVKPKGGPRRCCSRPRLLWRLKFRML